MVFIWPFLVLSLGLVFLTLGEWGNVGFLGPLTYLLWPLAIVFFIVLLFRALGEKPKGASSRGSWLPRLRSNVVIFSIGLLSPIFVRYLVEAFGSDSLPGIILGLIIGFGLAVSGLFMTQHRTIMYSNIFGGVLALIYVYQKLWDLGEVAQIIAASFGLLVAVVVSIIKLKDKLS